MVLVDEKLHVTKQCPLQTRNPGLHHQWKQIVQIIDVNNSDAYNIIISVQLTKNAVHTCVRNRVFMELW